jgi:hypothetical protein
MHGHLIVQAPGSSALPLTTYGMASASARVPRAEPAAHARARADATPATTPRSRHVAILNTLPVFYIPS